MASQVDALVLSKSLALVEKTKRRVAQIDTAEFPTPSSGIARDLLQLALESLSKPTFWHAMSPESLYQALIQLQCLVSEVETSTSAHISWPLVSYCDHFWRLLFQSEYADTQIFYSLCEEHNYGIRSFTGRLRRLLENLLPPDELNRILGKREVYCLQIASIEDENLPLYANIGHEFGHALYWAKQQDIDPLVVSECLPAYDAIKRDLFAQEAGTAMMRARRCAWVIRALATELFADLVGALIAGPAFLLSLHEMGWGVEGNSWSVALSPKDASIHAYPSFAFRLSCVSTRLRIGEFADGLRRNLNTLPKESDELKRLPEYLTRIPVNHQVDRVSARPTGDRDSTAIRDVLTKALPSLKIGLESFLNRSYEGVLARFWNMPAFSVISGEQVFQLIRRLDADVLPNIIPNDTLLGIPAPFGAILNAAALFRIHVLSSGATSSPSSEEMHRRGQKIERQTAKALEVSYIQQEFRAWKEADQQ